MNSLVNDQHSGLKPAGATATSGSAIGNLPLSTPVPHRSPARWCGASINRDESCDWCVWAPFADSVELVLDAESASPRSVAMNRDAYGYFSHREAGVANGCRYGYRLNGGPLRPDPVSSWQPDGVHRSSAVWSPDRFTWTDHDWIGVRREDLAIYELHVGAYTPEGTLDAIIPRLASLVELGITAIELMPLGQFPGERGWGYDGVHPFAVQNSYGGPHALQQLVNEAHRVGLGVILDVIYNHLGPEGNYLAEFGPYFTTRYNTPWGPALNFDDRGSDFVRGYVLQNVTQWISDFHLDGLRLDAVHAVFDSGPRHILSEIRDAARAEARRHGRIVHVMAESDLNDVRILNAKEQGGYALDAQWNDDFHHAVHALLTKEQDGYYSDFGSADHLVKALNQVFVYDGNYSHYHGRCRGGPVGEHGGDRFVVSIQNHDQVGNRACGDRFGTLLTPAQQRLAAGLMLFSPYIPLIFMGEEYGETNPFPYFCSFEDEELVSAVRNGRRREFADFCKLSDLPDPQSTATYLSAQLTDHFHTDSWHFGLMQLYRDLLHARKAWPALRNHRTGLASLVVGANGEVTDVLRLVRESDPNREARTLIGFFNLGCEPQPLPVSELADCRLIMSSEWSCYTAMTDFETQRNAFEILAPFEFCIYGLERRRLP